MGRPTSQKRDVGHPAPAPGIPQGLKPHSIATPNCQGESLAYREATPVATIVGLRACCLRGGYELKAGSGAEN